MLEQEQHFFDQHLAEWMTQFPGRFVLVKGDELIGTFNTIEEALAEGGRRFGLSSFLVRCVEREQKELTIPALMFGVLNAQLPHSVPRPDAGA